MKGVFVFLFISFLGTNLKAQQYILIENRGQVHFLDYQAVKFEYGTYRISKDHILAEDICGYHLVGYAWKLDSLILYLERGGVVTEKSVLWNSSIVVPQRESLRDSNLMSYYRQLKDPNAVYQYDDLTIKIRNRGHVTCYKGDSLLWEKSPRISSFGIGTYGLGYQNPVISQDKRTLLFQYATYFKQYLVEIGVLTGKVTKIGRNSDEITYSYSYSPDGNYILYRARNHRFKMYDKINPKRKTPLECGSWKNAFWLYR
ncbi:hypothetical protein [Butyricimonas sp.]|uniref:hypothetical protein n=1 Tax=Butyricimonas sp. TaxID=1969738 RepID=UPI0025C6A53D|nr:hypothetical protein [Butyricimonas sp.]